MADPTPANRIASPPGQLVSLPERDRLGAPLPSPLTSFVGRVPEVAQASGLLRQADVRLVTLTGPGGVGKTRLALRVAAEVADDFPDGVAFVPLAATTDQDLVLVAIAQALEIPESGDRPPLRRLTGALRSRLLLVVLDNFEHLVGAAASLAALLAACPGLKVLVTSRATLRVSGEHEFPVAPLPVPDLGRLPPIAELSRYGAVALFVQRARAAWPDFAIEEANAAAVAEVCRRLDGLPLAIELAAARTKVLSPQALLARLENRLALLTGGSRDHPERLRAMRETIAWSHDLLPPLEQVLFRRLAVFAGGCTVAAAEAVTGGEDGPASAVLDGLSSLADSSLLVQRPEADGEPRFSMLETIREYGLERLAESGEEEETRRRHAAWALAMAEDYYPILQRRLGTAPAIKRLASDQENLRSALAWLDRSGDAEGLIRLAGAISLFWYVQGHLSEGLSWLERALPRGDAAPAAVRARALLGAGMLAHYAADDARAVPWLEASLTLYRALGDPWGLVFTLTILGIVAEDAGDYDGAVGRLTESLDHARAAGNRVEAGLALLHLGIVAWGQGDHERAGGLLIEALEAQRASGDLDFGAAESLAHLSLLACERGDLPRSIELQRESLSLHLAVGATESVAANLANAGMVAVAARRPGAAARLLGAALGQREAIGNPFKLPERAVYDRAIAAAQAALPADDFAAACDAGRALTLAEAATEALAVLDEIADQVATNAPGLAGVSTATRDSGGLTAREMDVLHLLVQGRSDREIAEALFISPRTAQGHVARIFAKFNVNSRTAAVATALQRGLLTDRAVQR